MNKKGLLILIAVSITGILCASCPNDVPVRTDRTAARTSNAQNVIFFTDGSNFDDVVCLHLLLKSNRSKLAAIYIQGNGWANPGPTSRNFYNILHMHGVHNVPILMGSYYAMADELSSTDPWTDPISVNYRTVIPPGRGGILFADTLLGIAHRLPQGPVVYDPLMDMNDSDEASLVTLVNLMKSSNSSAKYSFLSTGSLTPIAKLFTPGLIDPGVLRSVLNKVSRVVVMGGAVRTGGNLYTKRNNLAAEFNVYSDPHAAQWAFGNLTAFGVGVTLVPLDATNNVPFQEGLLNALLKTPRTPEAQFVGSLMDRLRQTWYDPAAFYETAFLWDPTAVIVLLYDNDVAKPGGVKKVPIRVNLTRQNNIDLPDFMGATQECPSNSTQGCNSIDVVFNLDGNKVNKLVEDLMQSSVNSAVYPLFCPSA